MNVSVPPRIVRSVCYVPVEDIVPGPLQPRQSFPREGLEELRDSIAQHGVLQPLTVRLRGDRFELIAGERRLRAARLAGLREVPCIVMDVDMEKSGIIALIENIQRRDLDFLEEAEGIRQLIRLFGLSQEQVARRLGKSQSAVANKLRILRLPEDVRERLRAEGLSERHARALLRLPDEEVQRRALDFMIDQRMNVSAAETYVDRLCSGGGAEEPEDPEPDLPDAPAPRQPRPRRRSVFLMKDLRLFMNTLDRSLTLMRSGGIDAEMDRQDTDEAVVVTVKIRKNQ